MTSFSTHVHHDSGVTVGPHRTDDIYRSPGRWYVDLKSFSPARSGAMLEPAEARAIAHQLLAVADEVERLRKSEGT